MAASDPNLTEMAHALSLLEIAFDAADLTARVEAIEARLDGRPPPGRTSPGALKISRIRAILDEFLAGARGEPVPEMRANWANGLPHRLEQELWRRPGGATTTELASAVGRPRGRVYAALAKHPELFVALDRGASHRPGRWRLRDQPSEERTAT